MINRLVKQNEQIAEILQTIPEHCRGSLTLEYYRRIKEYLHNVG